MMAVFNIFSRHNFKCTYIISCGHNCAYIESSIVLTSAVHCWQEGDLASKPHCHGGFANWFILFWLWFGLTVFSLNISALVKLTLSKPHCQAGFANWSILFRISWFGYFLIKYFLHCCSVWPQNHIVRWWSSHCQNRTVMEALPIDLSCPGYFCHGIFICV